jgi:hypothetical protein
MHLFVFLIIKYCLCIDWTKKRKNTAKCWWIKEVPVSQALQASIVQAKKAKKITKSSLACIIISSMNKAKKLNNQKKTLSWLGSQKRV